MNLDAITTIFSTLTASHNGSKAAMTFFPRTKPQYFSNVRLVAALWNVDPTLTYDISNFTSITSLNI